MEKKLLSNPILKIFLEGVYDEECHLNKLLGFWHILEQIWRDVKCYWKHNIKETGHLKNQKQFKKDDMISFINLHAPSNYEHFPFIDQLYAIDDDSRYSLFPDPKDININMMPFIMHKDWEWSCLPRNLRPYWSLIDHCRLDQSQNNTVCYLTIQESWVEAGKAQRREGVHVERPGNIEIRSSNTDVDQSCFKKGVGESIVHKKSVYHSWGMGIGDRHDDRFEVKGGIYTATNVKHSSRFWDCQILDDNMIGHHGDLNHLQSILPKDPHDMAANCLYWFTDRTPHQSLPLKERTYRQYFRLVTSQVSLWFEDHSTKNPLVAPDPKITKIVKGSKFKAGDLRILSNGNDKKS